MSEASRSGALLLGALALHAALAVDSLRSSSATFDEGAHLPAGYTYLALGDHRLNPEQPPLVKLLAAAPLLALRPEFKADDEAWAAARQWELGRRFLYRWNDADRLLFWGRLPVVALACALGAAVFLRSRRRFGLPAAALALLLCVLSPDVLAHGRLVTTDLALALFFFATVVAFDGLTARATAGRLVRAGLALGAAFATKFSALILLPVLMGLGAAASLAPDPMTSALLGGERRVEGAGPRARHAAALLAAMCAVALAVLWGAYGFRGALSPDPGARAAGRAALAEPGLGPLGAAAVRAADLGLLPEDYVRGLLFVMRHSEARSTFLLGRLSDRGFPHYFLVTFALKTPLALVALLVLAGLAAPPLPRREAAFLWLPVLVYAAFALTSGLQIGHRHLLPIYPFLFVAAGRAALAARSRFDPPPSASRGTPRPAPLRFAVLGLAAWYALGTLRVHPHYLAYFNELAGGPGNGYRLLVDSNLDWGQDLKGLRAWMDARGVSRVRLSYFGSADPAYYGIEADVLPGYTAPHATHVTREVRPGDVVAVSATNLQGVYLDPADRPLMERFRRLAPVGQVGYSILVYRADFAWPPPP
ncbi:MAG TPA: glycosyltransferase family 39 protein [Vicinamibacteria bacterium]|nr:glycosyltransferase family 39 protein [Vicinamibacteria bacterium]